MITPDHHALDEDLVALLGRVVGKIGPKRRVVLHERADAYRPDRNAAQSRTGLRQPSAVAAAPSQQRQSERE